MSRQINDSMTQRATAEQNNRIQTSILNFTKRKGIKQIENKGYIDQIKYWENIRILSINVNYLSLQNDKKLDHIIDSCEKLQIDVIFIIEPNVKWTKAIEDRIHCKFKNLY